MRLLLWYSQLNCHLQRWYPISECWLETYSLLPIWLSTEVPGRATAEGPGTGAPASHVEEFFLAAIWGVNQ